MRPLFLATAFPALIFTFAANAADMRMPVKAPLAPVVAPFSWTGCYVGGNGGGMWAHKDFSVPAGQFDRSLDINGGLAGVQAGCNYQISHWVFGVQGDWDWSGASGTFNDNVFARLTNSVNINSLASVTGRVGYAWDRFLLYAKGGAAWETADFTSIGTNPFTIRDTRSGWTVGVGGEYAFLNWLTGFVEYDYYDFGTRSVTLEPFMGVVTFNVKETQSVMKAGLNVKFGPWAAHP